MILCCGEALVDMVPVTDAKGGVSYAPLSGGAIFNTAIALGRLKAPAGLLSGISTDLFGTQLVDTLHASNVVTDLLIRSERPTTLAFVRLQNGQASYTFYDENSANRMIETADLPQLSNETSTLYFGGISLCAEPAAEAYEALCLREAGDRVVMLDPNIRLGFISNETSYRARLNRMVSVADVVKVSDEDLDWMESTPASPEAKAKSLLSKGPKAVIVTKGSAGASAYLANGAQVDVAAPHVSVVDTVGAGDTFNAGFLAKLHSLGCLTKVAIADMTVCDAQAALDFAAKVAAVTVSRKGANPPTLAEL